MEKLETHATPRDISRLFRRVLDGLQAQMRRVFGKLIACSVRKDARTGKEKNSLNIPPASSAGIWYNAATREISHRRGF